MPSNFISSAADIVTSHRAVCEGFLSQAEAKIGKANPYVERARQFWTALQNIQNTDTLLDTPEFRNDLIAAAEFSQKACNHLSKSELDAALKSIFSRLFPESRSEFREEVLYRYLLTMGDTLGGQMRNFTGAEAGIKFTRALLDTLQPYGSVLELKQSKKTEKI